MSAPFLDQLKADTRPVSPLRPAWQYALGASLISLLVVALGIRIMGTKGWYSLDTIAWALLLPGLALTLFGSSWAAAQWMGPTGRATLHMALAGYAVGLGGLFYAGESGSFSPWLAFKCFLIATPFVTVTALGSFFLLRRSFGPRSNSTALAAGLLSGTVGFLVIQILCPIKELGHLLAGHGILPFFWGFLAYSTVKLSYSLKSRL
ncbi:MAG: hypothetical protein NW208_19455 [Bryobacter sp.]|nr:hypothetical protein [Bryobacter sp.]